MLLFFPLSFSAGLPDTIYSPHPCRFLAPYECFAEDFDAEYWGSSSHSVDGTFDIDRWDTSSSPEWEIDAPNLEQKETHGTYINNASCAALHTIGSLAEPETMAEAGARNVVLRYDFEHTSSVNSDPSYGSVGVMFRYVDKENYYVVEWNDEFACLKVGRVRDEVHTTLNHTSKNYCEGACLSGGISDTWSVRVEAEEADIRVYINDVLELVATDPDPILEPGSLGVYTSRANRVHFRNLLFYALERESQVAGYEALPSGYTPCSNLATSACVVMDFDDYDDDYVIAADNAVLNDEPFHVVEDGKRKDWEPFFGGEHARWIVRNGELRHDAPTGRAQDDLCIDSLGTFLVVLEANKVKSPERVITFRMRNDHSGAVGLMYNIRRPVMGVRSTWEYVRFDWSNEENCQNLVLYKEGEFSLYDSDSEDMERETWYDVEIWIGTEFIDTVVDGEVTARQVNPGVIGGEIAFYCYDSARCKFDDLLVAERRVAHRIYEAGSVTPPPPDAYEQARSQLGDSTWTGIMYRQHGTQIFSNGTLGDSGCVDAEYLAQRPMSFYFDSAGHMEVLMLESERTDDSDVSWRLDGISEYRWVDGVSSSRLYFSHYDWDAREFPVVADVTFPANCDLFDQGRGSWTTRDSGQQCSGGDSENVCCPGYQDYVVPRDLVCADSGDTYTAIAYMFEQTVYSPLYPPQLTFTKPSSGEIWLEFDDSIDLEWEGENVLGTEEVTIEVIRASDGITAWLANVPIDRSSMHNAFAAIGEYEITELPYYMFVDETLLLSIRLNGTSSAFDTVLIRIRCDECRELTITGNDTRVEHCDWSCNDPAGCIDLDVCSGTIECSEATKGWGGELVDGDYVECHRFADDELARCGFRSGCTKKDDYEYCSGPGILNKKGKCFEPACKRYDLDVCAPFSPAGDWNSIVESCHKGEPSQNCTAKLGAEAQPSCDRIGRCISLLNPTPIPYVGPPTPEPTFVPPTNQPSVVPVPTPAPTSGGPGSTPIPAGPTPQPTFQPTPMPTQMPTVAPPALQAPDPPCHMRTSCDSCSGAPALQELCGWCNGTGGGYCARVSSEEFQSCFLLPGYRNSIDFNEDGASCPERSDTSCSDAHGANCESCLGASGCAFCFNATEGAETGGCFQSSYKNGCASLGLDWIDDFEGGICPVFIATPAPTGPPTPFPPSPAPTQPQALQETCPPKEYNFADPGGCVAEIQRASTTAMVVRGADNAHVLTLRAGAGAIARPDAVFRVYLKYVVGSSVDALPPSVQSLRRRRRKRLADTDDMMSEHLYALQLHESSRAADVLTPFAGPLLVCAPIVGGAHTTACLAQYSEAAEAWLCIDTVVEDDPDQPDTAACGEVTDGFAEVPNYKVYVFMRNPEAIEEFDESDGDGDGFVDEEELEDAVDNCMCEVDEPLDEILDMFDKDGDGKLDEDEFYDYLDWVERKRREAAGEGEASGPGSGDGDDEDDEEGTVDKSTDDDNAVALAVGVAVGVLCYLCIMCLIVFLVNRRRSEKPVFVVDKGAEMVDFADLKAEDADDDSRDEEVPKSHRGHHGGGSHKGSQRRHPNGGSTAAGRGSVVAAENLEVEYIEEISSSDSSEDLVVAIP